jgi:hypothetical protein
MSMPVTVRMSACLCMLALMLVPMNIFTCMFMSMIVVVPTVIVSLHRPHLT